MDDIQSKPATQASRDGYERVIQCTCCGIQKTIDQFDKRKDTLSGIRLRCKACRRIYAKNYHETYKEKKQEYYQSHRKEKKAYDSAQHKKNKSKNNARSKKYREAHKEQANKREREKRKTDPKFRLNKTVVGNIRSALNGTKNGRSWEFLVDYTLEDLIKHLEKQFTEGMTWENYGKDGWWIDHKIPIAVFNFTEPEHEDFKRCWALKNLQPMWAKENMSKGMKLEKHFQARLLF